MGDVRETSKNGEQVKTQWKTSGKESGDKWKTRNSNGRRLGAKWETSERQVKNDRERSERDMDKYIVGNLTKEKLGDKWERQERDK